MLTLVGRWRKAAHAGCQEHHDEVRVFIFLCLDSIGRNAMSAVPRTLHITHGEIPKVQLGSELLRGSRAFRCSDEVQGSTRRCWLMTWQ